jgi:hypothetical protein
MPIVAKIMPKKFYEIATGVNFMELSGRVIFASACKKTVFYSDKHFNSRALFLAALFQLTSRVVIRLA